MDAYETEGRADSAGSGGAVCSGAYGKESAGSDIHCSSGAYLWDYMKDHEFQKEDLVKKILEHYTGVTGEQAAVDIEKFLKTLADNNILDDGKIRGQVFVKMPKGTGKDGV